MNLAEATSTIDTMLTPVKTYVFGLIEYFLTSWFGIVIVVIFVLAIIALLIKFARGIGKHK